MIPRNIFFLLLVFALNTGHAVSGISSIGEFRFGGLEPGRTYSFTGMNNTPFRVTNTGENPVDVRMYAETPKDSDLKPGCAALPQVSWVRIAVSTFTVPGRNLFETDVFITVPDDGKYSGKKYQFYIISETIPRGEGLVYNIALKSRVIFTVAEKKSKKFFKKKK